MNYRHIFHAGNFADVFKHIVWTRVILHLQKKDKAFRLYDTHGGIGLYDLSSNEAQRTGEWQNGIGKLVEADIPADIRALIQPYFSALDLYRGQKIAVYPGSPCLARRLMRKQDRLAAYELHPEDFDVLASHFQGDHQARITRLDGWMALTAHVPPKEKRGAVLIDPPFEAPDEFDLAARKLVEAHGKWPGGTYGLWYPAKNKRAVDHLIARLKEASIPDILRLELTINHQKPDGPMVSTGMVLINPPYTLRAQADAILPWLAKTLNQAPLRNQPGHLIEVVSEG